MNVKDRRGAPERGRRALGWVGAALALTLTVAPAAMSADDRDEIFSQYGQAIEPYQVTQVPDVYYGKTVLVEGDVDNVYGPGVISLEGTSDNINVAKRSQQTGTEDLIVIIPQELRAGLGAAIDEDDKVKVVGEVRKGTIAEFDDLDEIGDDVDMDVDSETVLIARAIAIR